MSIDYNQAVKKYLEANKDKVPIYKGCPNYGNPCFCTGKCKEIIGWADKHPASNQDLLKKPFGHS